jgi:hypothetical protein
VKSNKYSLLHCQRSPAVPARYDTYITLPRALRAAFTESWVRTESDTCRVVGTGVTVVGKWTAKHENSVDLDSGGAGEVRVTEILQLKIYWAAVQLCVVCVANNVIKIYWAAVQLCIVGVANTVIKIYWAYVQLCIVCAANTVIKMYIGLKCSCVLCVRANTVIKMYIGLKCSCVLCVRANAVIFHYKPTT